MVDYCSKTLRVYWLMLAQAALDVVLDEYLDHKCLVETDRLT